MKAIWNQKLIAESEDIIPLEGNYYFPAGDVNTDFLKKSDTRTVCHWIGVEIVK